MPMILVALSAPDPRSEARLTFRTGRPFPERGIGPEPATLSLERRSSIVPGVTGRNGSRGSPGGPRPWASYLLRHSGCEGGVIRVKMAAPAPRGRASAG
jgi:hypothetical protein